MKILKENKMYCGMLIHETQLHTIILITCVMSKTDLIRHTFLIKRGIGEEDLICAISLECQQMMRFVDLTAT